MTTIEKIEKGIITLAEFTEDQQSFIRGIVKLSFNEGQLKRNAILKNIVGVELVDYKKQILGQNV